MRLCTNCLSSNLTPLIAVSYRAWFRCEDCDKTVHYRVQFRNGRVWRAGSTEPERVVECAGEIR